MKRLVTPLVAAAVVMAALGPVAAQACNKDKAKTSATSASATVTKTSAVYAAGSGSCASKHSAAVASNGASCSAKTSAAVASNGASCASKHSAAVAANGKSCGSKATSAVTASTVIDAWPAGASCHSDATAKGVKGAHADCVACADVADCDGELSTAGAHRQVVPLKNGVMYVYTAEGASKVHAVQAALARRTDRLGAMVAAGDKAKLCGECKKVRGAMASGKLSREVVNIEGGCLTLMTSNDPAMVAKIHEMAGLSNANRKS